MPRFFFCCKLDLTVTLQHKKVLRASAVLRGRLACVPADLWSMRFLTTYRVPEEVHEESVPKILKELIAKAERA